MPFATTDEHIRKAEEALGVQLPAVLRERLLRDNGGEIEAADDIWQLFPVQDTTDRKRLSRTASHIVRETAEARKWDGFPSRAIAIASNGSGDYLILQDMAGNGNFADTVLLWSHDDASVTPVDVTWQP
jgi:hypothetical protein